MLVAYIPIINGGTVPTDVIDALLLQVDKVEMVECGEPKARNDKTRYIDIGKGKEQGFRKSVISEDKYFVHNNSRSLHLDEYGFARCKHFLDKNPDWGGVALTPFGCRVSHLTKNYIRLESVMFRTEAVKDLHIEWGKLQSDGVTIKNALNKKGYILGYLEKDWKHIKKLKTIF